MWRLCACGSDAGYHANGGQHDDTFEHDGLLGIKARTDRHSRVDGAQGMPVSISRRSGTEFGASAGFTEAFSASSKSIGVTTCDERANATDRPPESWSRQRRSGSDGVRSLPSHGGL